MGSTVKIVENLPTEEVENIMDIMGEDVDTCENSESYPEGALCITLNGKTILFLEEGSEAHQNYLKYHE